jgi:hypothetical protein
MSAQPLLFFTVFFLVFLHLRLIRLFKTKIFGNAGFILRVTDSHSTASFYGRSWWSRWKGQRAVLGHYTTACAAIFTNLTKERQMEERFSMHFFLLSA